MRAGILTFHRAQNYGAVLQCYALSAYLKSLGCETEVVDYYPQVFREEYAGFPRSTFKRASLLGKIHTLLLYITRYPASRKRSKQFDRFIHQYLPLSSRQYDDKNHDLAGYDVLFFGSDQIWNPRLTGGFDDVFTGNFEKGNTSFVAYAASTMLTEENESRYNCSEAFKGILSRFDAVSTREKAFADYLGSIGDRKVEHVLDPVFLLSAQQWEKIAVKPKEQDYLLVYSVPDSDKVVSIAKQTAKSKGLKTIVITSRAGMSFCSRIKQTLSPEQFVGYFRHAAYIVTSSFHGVAFSIRFNKQFHFVPKGNVSDDRVCSLLKDLNMLTEIENQSKSFIGKALIHD